MIRLQPAAACNLAHICICRLPKESCEAAGYRFPWQRKHTPKNTPLLCFTSSTICYTCINIKIVLPYFHLSQENVKTMKCTTKVRVTHAWTRTEDFLLYLIRADGTNCPNDSALYFYSFLKDQKWICHSFIDRPDVVVCDYLPRSYPIAVNVQLLFTMDRSARVLPQCSDKKKKFWSEAQSSYREQLCGPWTSPLHVLAANSHKLRELQCGRASSHGQLTVLLM